MQAHTHFRLALGMLVLVLGVAGCDSSASRSPFAPSPLAGPSPPPTPAPAGSVQLAGTVADAAWRPLANAVVEVVSGPDAGRSTTTDARGDYRLNGNFDENTIFRATHQGHVAATRPLPAPCGPCNPDWWIHFYLESAAPAANLAGAYTVTFTADSTCASLPEVARSRSYDAVVTLVTNPNGPANSHFDVAPGGGSFVHPHDRFTIGVAGDYLVAWLGDGHGGAGLVEQVGEQAYVTLAGDFALTVTDPSTISAPFRGVFDYCELPGEWGTRRHCLETAPLAAARCEASNHRLELTRR